MKIKRVQFNRYGGIAEMYVGEYELPPLKRDEVQVKVKESGLRLVQYKTTGK